MDISTRIAAIFVEQNSSSFHGFATHGNALGQLINFMTKLVLVVECVQIGHCYFVWEALCSPNVCMVTLLHCNAKHTLENLWWCWILFRTTENIWRKHQVPKLWYCRAYADSVSKNLMLGIFLNAESLNSDENVSLSWQNYMQFCHIHLH